MSDWNWQLLVGCSLMILSGVLYYLQIIIFDNVRDTLFYLLQDLAFMPVQILLVTLLVNQLLSMREKRVMLKKMNMVIGVFFSEIGIDLLKTCCDFDHHSDQLKKSMMIDAEWSTQKFRHAYQVLQKHDYKIDGQKGDLTKIRDYLLSKRQFLLGLLENPNLLEHDSFTELLWAVFHLAEELAHRESVEDLSISDYGHIAGDIERVYGLVIYEWLAYMQHLQKDYPYLFSLAMRKNPFNDHPETIVK
ncbi:hypothetical protein [Pelosinus sp. sgz500959]|uniref:hypothetical protein n=1 Tax=Pelosinus sp. sgz500959 TaxID=3242472 RepID=UPI00366D8B84